MTTETPKMWDVINKMNDELAEVQEENERLKEEISLNKKTNINYQNVIKNLIWKVLKKDGSGDDEPECLDDGIDLFEYAKLKNTSVESIEKIFIEEQVIKLNEEDWNNDDGYARLNYNYTDEEPVLEMVFNDSDED